MSAESSLAAALTELKGLHETGLLTDAVYADRQNQLLDGSQRFGAAGGASAAAPDTEAAAGSKSTEGATELGSEMDLAKIVLPVKAYKNMEFLQSSHAQSIRIQCEHAETEARLSSHGIEDTCMFFASARGRSFAQHAAAKAKAEATGDVKGLERCALTAWMCPYYDQITELSMKITQWSRAKWPERQRYVICTGGGPGMMEAANKGALQVPGAKSVGMGISLPFEPGLNPYVSPELAFEFHYFFMRKFCMVKRCGALVVAPGGLGTCDELFEMTTLMQTGKHRRIPIVLFGKDFWTKSVGAMIDTFVEHGTVSASDKDNMYITDDIDDAFTYITSRLEALEEPVVRVESDTAPLNLRTSTEEFHLPRPVSPGLSVTATPRSKAN